jgi:murein DD-endopeptidase MepM/ murein hydrolase activator NlpD
VEGCFRSAPDVARLTARRFAIEAHDHMEYHPFMHSPFLPRHIVDPTRELKSLGIVHINRRVLAIGSMVFAGLMTSVPVLPASAEFVHSDATEVILQEFETSAAVVVPETTRDSYTVSEFSLVQAPTSMGSLSSGFGYRNSPCSSCTSDHEGLDLTPGAGTAVAAIADGVVVDAGNPSGTLGVFVVIDHVINGEKITSVYAHMQYRSLAVSVGDTVTVGQQLGRVGSTGVSTGAHLHFEIRPGGGDAIDPLRWLRTHINY